ncbi:nucleolar protein 14 [Chytridium lagenaria]|nr:nucleolar protein 14 [Chytridium lagenaria]
MPEKKSGGSAIKSLKALVKDKRVHDKKGKRLGTNDPKPKALRMNPFELQFSRAKHDVIGRKLKGVEGKPLLKRKVAEETRTKTLAVELAKKSRVAKFVDRRFGENDPSMSIEDKMLERFMKERQGKSDRRSNFNLEEEDELTHLGKSLSSFEDFNDGMDDFDGMDDQIDANTVSMAHFGNFDDEDGSKKKSRNEIMQEIIAKSKAHKFERQQQNEDNQKLVDEVDTDLDMIRNLLLTTDGVEQTKPKRPEADDYDRQVRELQNELRSKPSNRTKSEEEEAVERKKHLEELESRRMARMSGIYDSETIALSEPRKAQGDDLGGIDILTQDKEPALEYNAGVFSRPGESEDEGDIVKDGLLSKLRRKKDRLEAKIVKLENDIPYVFDFPISYLALQELLQDRTANDQDIVVRRIRDLYHIKLAAENSSKAQGLNLLRYLLEYVLSFSGWEEGVDAIRRLSAHIFELSVEFPDVSAGLFKEAIDEMHSSLQSSKPQDIKAAVSMRQIILFKLIGSIFSVSDMEHCVSSPATNAICQYLSLSAALPSRTSAFGVLCCDILLEYQKDSKRFLPEPIRFLQKLLVSLTAKTTNASSLGFTPYPILHLCTSSNTTFKSLKEILSLAAATLNCLCGFAALYKDNMAFIELFEGTIKHLTTIPLDVLPPSIRTIFSEKLAELQRLNRLSVSIRKPLSLLKIKPIAIETYAPKFDVNYSLDRRQDVNREQAKSKKMKAEYKKEFKGAIRELRKDGKFIARKRLEEKTKEAQRYKKKMDSILGDLANQEGAMRGMEKMKKKMRL